MRAYLTGGEIENARQVPVDRLLAAVGVGHGLVEERQLACLFDILHNRRDEPERVVRARVLQAVDDLALVGRGNDRGGLERLLRRVLFKPARLEQVQAVALLRQRAQKLDQAAAAFFGVRMRDHHRVLRRVAVAEADAPADLNERGEAGEHDVDLALVEVPDVELGVHALVRGADLQAGELAVPEFCEACEILVCLFRRPAGLGRFSGLQIPLAEQEQQSRFLARSQRHVLLQHAAVVSALLAGNGAYACLDRKRVPFCAVRAEKAVAQAGIAVGREIGRKELIAGLLIIQIVFDHAVRVPAAGGVEAHLEVLVVHLDLMEAEFQIGKNG